MVVVGTTLKWSWYNIKWKWSWYNINFVDFVNGEYKSDPLFAIEHILKQMHLVFITYNTRDGWNPHTTPDVYGYLRNSRCHLKLFTNFLFPWRQTHRQSSWQNPHTTPVVYGFPGNPRCLVKLLWMSYLILPFSAARDTLSLHAAIVLKLVSWQCWILRTCWMSKAFADCNSSLTLRRSVIQFYGLGYGRISPTFGEFWK